MMATTTTMLVALMLIGHYDCDDEMMMRCSWHDDVLMTKMITTMLLIVMSWISSVCVSSISQAFVAVVSLVQASSNGGPGQAEEGVGFAEVWREAGPSARADQIEHHRDELQGLLLFVVS